MEKNVPGQKSIDGSIDGTVDSAPILVHSHFSDGEKMDRAGESFFYISKLVNDHRRRRRN